MPQVQQELFSHRYTRRLWLEKLVLIRFRRKDGRLARTHTIKTLLSRIESHGERCCVKLATLAGEIGVDARTVSRYIADAVACGLLKVTPANGTASSYEIQWTEVAQVILDNPTTTRVIDPHHRPANQSPPGSETHDNLTSTHDNLAQTHDNLTSTHDNLSPPPSGHTSLTRARLKPCFNHDNPMSKPSFDAGGEIGLMGKTKTSGKSSGFCSWPKPIGIADLTGYVTLQALWEHALTKPGMRPEHRLRFFTLAGYVVDRNSKEPLISPGGMFNTQLKKSIEEGIWPGNDTHEARAKKQIEIIDHYLKKGVKPR